MKLSPSLFILPASAHDAATNMAIDAALFDSVPETSAILRHYGWTEPAITFGYTQGIAAVKTAVPSGIKLCRRLTGGGIVDHRNDWTYALILHSRTEAAQLQATELYTAVHHCIQQALADQSVKTQLAPCPRACGQSPEPLTEPSQCFVHPTANDVLRPDGRKIAGAAMKRNRQGLLIQGSIDRNALPETFNYTHFTATFSDKLSNAFNINSVKNFENLPDQQIIQQERLRFEDINWTNKR